jgi:intracellular sulfur oxidation DsrE/DsrF family protein
MSASKIAVVIYEPIGSDTSRVYRGLKTALEFKDAGDDIVVVFDGSGVESLAAISDPKHKMNPLAVALHDNIRGACAFCVASHGVTDAVEARRVAVADGVQGRSKYPFSRRRGLPDPQLLSTTSAPCSLM